MVPFDVPCGVSAAAFLLDYPVFYVVTLPSSHVSSVAPGAAAGLLSMQPLRMLYIGISLPLSQHGGGSSSSSCRDDVGGGEPESELDLMQCTCPESLFDILRYTNNNRNICRFTCGVRMAHLNRGDS